MHRLGLPLPPPWVALGLRVRPGLEHVLGPVEKQTGRVRLDPVEQGEAAEAGRGPVAQDAARVAALFFFLF